MQFKYALEKRIISCVAVGVAASVITATLIPPPCGFLILAKALFNHKLISQSLENNVVAFILAEYFFVGLFFGFGVWILSTKAAPKIIRGNEINNSVAAQLINDNKKRF